MKKVFYVFLSLYLLFYTINEFTSCGNDFTDDAEDILEYSDLLTVDGWVERGATFIFGEDIYSSIINFMVNIFYLFLFFWSCAICIMFSSFWLEGLEEEDSKGNKENINKYKYGLTPVLTLAILFYIFYDGRVLGAFSWGFKWTFMPAILYLILINIGNCLVAIFLHIIKPQSKIVKFSIQAFSYLALFFGVDYILNRFF